MTSSKNIGIMAALMAALVWSSSFIALKIALETIHPMSVIFSRMLIASCIFLFFYKQFIKLRFTKDDIKYILIMVFCEPCLYFMFEVKALELTSASQAGVITSTMPLITAIGAGILLKEVITKRVLAGSIIAMAGAIWLSFSASVQEYAPNPVLGNFLEILAMICGAGYALALKHLTSKFSALFLTAVQAFAGALFFAPFALYEWITLGLSIDTSSFLAILYLGVVVTIGGYGLFNYALSLLPASKVSSFINLIPAFTIILAFILLGERLNTMQFIASGVIFFGVFVSQSGNLRKRRGKKSSASQ